MLSLAVFNGLHEIVRNLLSCNFIEIRHAPRPHHSWVLRRSPNLGCIQAFYNLGFTRLVAKAHEFYLVSIWFFNLIIDWLGDKEESPREAPVWNLGSVLNASHLNVLASFCDSFLTCIYDAKLQLDKVAFPFLLLVSRAQVEDFLIIAREDHANAWQWEGFKRRNVDGLPDRWWPCSSLKIKSQNELITKNRRRDLHLYLPKRSEQLQRSSYVSDGQKCLYYS